MLSIHSSAIVSKYIALSAFAYCLNIHENARWHAVSLNRKKTKQLIVTIS